jgi:hypothetical protein
VWKIAPFARLNNETLTQSMFSHNETPCFQEQYAQLSEYLKYALAGPLKPHTYGKASWRQRVRDNAYDSNEAVTAMPNQLHP